jgi:hypothetical protein
LALIKLRRFCKRTEEEKDKIQLIPRSRVGRVLPAEQKKTVLLKTQIDTTDKEIDKMVYELYGLTKEEIEIVENS